MNVLSKMIVVATTTVATTAAMAFGSTSAAWAGTDRISQIAGSWSRFISAGDKFENCDTEADWLISYVQFQYVRIDGSVQEGAHYNPGNNGDCFEWDHNFGEGRTVWLRSCVDQPAPFPDTCDTWRTGVA